MTTRDRRTGERHHRITREERRRQIIRRTTIAGAACLGAVFIVGIGIRIFAPSIGAISSRQEGSYDTGSPTKQVPMPELDVQLLTVNEYSRPGISTDGVQGVVVHYTANPGSTAQNNRDYFESLKDTKDNQVSSNFIIGMEGEIIQCIPTSEIAYASNSRNNDTVSIECCHPDETGEFTEATYDSLVELVAFLCGKFNLTTDDVIRHYDVTGKECPKYFVDHEDKWQEFKEDVAKYIQENGE